MSLASKPIEQLALADIESLLRERVAESRVLDYKRDKIGSSDRERNEFLADVTSFANSSGGELLIGISEDGGIPTDLTGIELDDPDGEILRLEQIVRTGVRPAISGLQSRAIELSKKRYALILRIPKSWSAPHQVGQQGSFRFYGRGSNGKFQLDVDELRSLFRLGPDIAERIRLFRADRLGKIITNTAPATLPNGSKIVIHAVPLNSFSTRGAIDLAPIDNNKNILSSVLDSGGQTHINIDGYIAESRHADSVSKAYAQLFRDGVIELAEFVEPWEVRGHNFLPGQAFDEMIQTTMAGIQRTYKALRISSPVAVLLTLLGMEDRLMGSGKQYGYDGERKFRDREIVCPEVVLNDLDSDPKSLAYPITTLAWNAAGYKQSVFYDDKGKWLGS